MAEFDTADLLTRCKRMSRVPVTTEFAADTDWYAWLGEAENRVKGDLAPIVPKALIGAPTALTTADSGLTYTFGTDSDGNNILPIGNVEVYRNLADIPWAPLTPGVDFLFEGERIRGMNNQPVYGSGGTLYARFITPTLKINASTAPTLEPVQMRELLVYDAVRRYYEAGGLRDIQSAEDRYQSGLMKWIATLQTQYSQQMSRAALRGQTRAWWRTSN